MNAIIYKMCSAHGNMYAVIKAILKENEGLNLGSVKAPLAPFAKRIRKWYPKRLP